MSILFPFHGSVGTDMSIFLQPPWLEDLPNERPAYWRGYYDACRTLDCSVRMNKPQREVIWDTAMVARERLEELGVKFVDGDYAGG